MDFDLSDEQTNDGNGLLSVTIQISNCCGVAMAAGGSAGLSQ